MQRWVTKLIRWRRPIYTPRRGPHPSFCLQTRTIDNKNTLWESLHQKQNIKSSCVLELSARAIITESLRHTISKMSSPLFGKVEGYSQPTIREESGYASAASSQESLTEVYFTKPHLKFINAQLQKLEPQGELC